MSTAPELLAAALLWPRIAEKKIVIILGSGGVGKTSTAAALGLTAARRGKKTLVMTIDPAQRLATALGLPHLDNEPRDVPLAELQGGHAGDGQLQAIMLDAKKTIDELLLRYAPDAETVQKLLKNRIYQRLSSRLAGSQEYAAMEKLFEIDQDQKFDLLILDTPPTANAFDFLEAPQKMIDAVDSPAVHWFIDAYTKAGRMSLSLLGFGASFILRRLARFTGGEFLDEIARFLNDFSSLLGGLHQRAAAVLRLLSAPQTGFLVITAPNAGAIDEAIALHQRLHQAKLPVLGTLVNKVHQVPDTRVDSQALDAHIVRETGLPPAESRHLEAMIEHAYEQMRLLARLEEQQVRRLEGLSEALLPQWIVPYIEEEVCDLPGLNRLAQYL